jgi:hypothetical protein
MSMDTPALIEMLTRDLRPVRQTRAPWLDTSIWSIVSIASVIALIAVLSHNLDRLTTIRLSRFWFEQLAALTTGVTAAAAVFASVVPGMPRRWLWLPAVPVIGWLAVLASGCLRDWAARGSAGLLPHADWPCTLAMTLGAIVPVATILVMARRGAPLTPTRTAALAGLAGAAVSSVVACMSRPMPHPTTMTVAVWHLGTLLAVVLAVAQAGPRVLAWPAGAELIASNEASARQSDRRNR